MIAAAIVCAAALSQAATVSWTATKNATYDGVEDASKYCAYLVDVYGATTTYADTAAVAAALKAGTFDGKIIYEATSDNGLSAVGNSPNKTLKINVSAKPTVGTFANEQQVSYYSIIFNAADVADATQFLAHTPEAVSAQFSSAGALSVALQDQSAKTWAAIPEPTSGLLLLLGVAGLALRRRRA